jgi:putative phosphoesterase
MAPRLVGAILYGVRVGVVSDIHCNEGGLLAALDAMGEVDELLCLGDSIFESQFSNGVVRILRDRGAHVIQGNHEEVFFSPAGANARAGDRIDPTLLGYLADQPVRRTLTLDGLRLLLVHSTPWEPRGGYVYPHSRDLARFADADADVVLYGHTHVQLVRQVGAVLVVNPGSAGAAQDPGNGKRLSCAVLDTRTRSVEITNFPDPRFPDGLFSGARAT